MIQSLLSEIMPFDAAEAKTLSEVQAWAASGVELCRIAPPADPDPHLVSYFAVVDGGHILLGDHRKAGLWLPSGGHVEPGEHPKDTVIREAAEELSLTAEFLFPVPIFLTATLTQGPDPHTDVSLWYVLKGDRHAEVAFDPGEYHGVRWFPLAALPQNSDPEIGRFASKLAQMMEAA